MIKSKNIIYNTKDDLFSLQKICSDYDTDQILIQVFSGKTALNTLQLLLSDLIEVFPDIAIIGTTTSGEIVGDTLLEQNIVINITMFEQTKVITHLITQNDNLFEAGKEIGTSFSKYNPKALILFGCGLKNKRTIDGTDLLDSLKEELPNTIISGGQAGDNGVGEITYVFTQEGITSQGVSAASLSGEELNVNNSYNLAWIPIGTKLTITKVKGSRVYSINNQTPYDLYSHYLGKDVAEGLPLSAVDFPLIIERDGIPMAIHATGVNDDGSFDYIHSFTAGEQLQFGFCHIGLLERGAQKTFNQLKEKEAQALFIYSCVSRKWILGSDVSLEINSLTNLATTSGFFSYGEYYSHPSGKNLFLSQTMTVLTLAEGTQNKTSVIDEFSSKISNEDSKQLKTLRVLHRLVETSAIENEKINAELIELSEKDTLTGLYNRRYMNKHLESELKRTRRSTESLSMLFIDIDFFKQYNDAYGHVAGDNCLRGVAGEISNFTKRLTDIAIRYGGEEFICIFPLTSFDGAMTLAEELRQAIEKLNIQHVDSLVSDAVTISIGVITIKNKNKYLSSKEFIDLCDEQLYLAKELGRNQIHGKDFS